MSFFSFGEGLLFIQIPDVGLKKVSLETQFFNMNRKYLFFVDTYCRLQLWYCDGRAKPRDY